MNSGDDHSEIGLREDEREWPARIRDDIVVIADEYGDVVGCLRAELKRVPNES